MADTPFTAKIDLESPTGAATSPPKPLSASYYLDDFSQVIEGVRARYGVLLTAEEHQHLAKFDAVSEPARMLYARLVNRRGPCFRVARLNYPEIGALDLPLAELLEASLLQPCREAPDSASQTQLLACFTHVELIAALRRHSVPKQRRKDGLLSWLATWDDCANWLAQFLVEHTVVRIPAADPWPFLRFLFFGEQRDNLSDFVTRALGHVVTERIEAAQLNPQFTSRQQADDAYRMATLYVEFRRVRDAQNATVTLDWWRSQNIERAALAAGHDWFDRLVDRLGRLLERENELTAALSLYGTSPVAPARERRVRLLLKAGATSEAVALLHAMRDSPCHVEEAYAARQLLARLEKNSRRSEARHYQQISESLVLDYLPGGVEAAVLVHYRAQGWQGVHSENWLWNAAFGLLLWDVIYDPAFGVFHSPLQFAPSDLHDAAFYLRRKEPIEARLATLTEPSIALEIMQRHFQAKNGTANPFVYWHDELPDLLHVMLYRLPPQGLAAALRHLAQDIRRHSRGLPDLFLWNERDYRFVEIKAENDHLAGHQFEWLRVLSVAGIRVSLKKVERPGLSPAPATARVTNRSASGRSATGIGAGPSRGAIG